MAEVEVKDSGKGGKKGQQKKMKIHVDFTPMVDMNMLLITFFMFFEQTPDNGDQYAYQRQGNRRRAK